MHPEGAAIDLKDGLPNLLGLRFAHDILLFANSRAVGRSRLVLKAGGKKRRS